MKENYKEILEMKIKKITLVISMIVNIIVCLCLNFNEILTGGPIGNKNIVVSICYLLAWILIILFSRYIKSKKLLKVFLGYWVFNLLIYFLVALLLKFEINISIIILFYVIFIGPMHGLFFYNTNIMATIIGALMSIFIFYFIKKTP